MTDKPSKPTRRLPRFSLRSLVLFTMKDGTPIKGATVIKTEQYILIETEDGKLRKIQLSDLVSSSPVPEAKLTGSKPK